MLVMQQWSGSSGARMVGVVQAVPVRLGMLPGETGEEGESQRLAGGLGA